MRTDLLALTDDALASLANRGLVKRAARELAEGLGPVVAEDAAGAVTGTFPDGTVASLPSGAPVDRAACTCGSTAVCRHRVMTAMAYREGAAATVDAPSAAWSPGVVDDDTLEALLGSRVLAAARKARRAGFRARVRRARPGAGDEVPMVELASCTVRFLVPDDLAYARVDAVSGARDDAVALAVWAFRHADGVDPVAPVLDVEVRDGAGSVAGAGADGIGEVVPVLHEVVSEGVVHVGTSLGPQLAVARQSLDRRNLRWPVDAVDQLVDLLDAYTSRSARYRPEQAAAVMAELVARHRCVVGGGASLRTDVFGTEEAAETPLKLVRLTGLGARVGGDASNRSVEVYLAHPEVGVVLTVHRRFDLDEDETMTGEEAGRRKVSGTRLAALAAGNVVTASAVRAANRSVRIAESRVARTTVSPSAGRWDDLPAGILVADLEAEAARHATLAPRFVRPRLVAEGLRAVVVTGVEAVHYRPGAQQLVATVHAPVGQARLVVEHTAATSGAIGEVASVLAGERGELRFVAGHVRRHNGTLWIEPTALAAGDAVIVPAFAADDAVDVGRPPAPDDDPVSAAVATAIAVVAEVPHHGWSRLPSGWLPRAATAVEQLRVHRMDRSAAAVDALARATRGTFSEAGFDAWADAAIRLAVLAERS